MNARKIETRQNRLNQVQAKIEARKKDLAARGLDAKLIEKDSTMRHLLAEARKVKRSIKSLQRDPAGKPSKEAAQPKAKKPPKEKKPKGKKPKEKKPKQEEEAPPG
jgi:hypothetical protein